MVPNDKIHLRLCAWNSNKHVETNTGLSILWMKMIIKGKELAPFKPIADSILCSPTFWLCYNYIFVPSEREKNRVLFRLRPCSSKLRHNLTTGCWEMIEGADHFRERYRNRLRMLTFLSGVINVIVIIARVIYVLSFIGLAGGLLVHEEYIVST